MVKLLKNDSTAYYLVSDSARVFQEVWTWEYLRALFLIDCFFSTQTNASHYILTEFTMTTLMAGGDSLIAADR